MGKMIKQFLRLFEEYRYLEKDLEREAALADSMERYIDALEGRDMERLVFINALETKSRERLFKIEELEGELRDIRSALGEALEAAADLRARLADLYPNCKGEKEP
jgi:DNA repair ATPase RecN